MANALEKVRLARGNTQEAATCFHEALQFRQELGRISGVAWMLELLGEVAVATGDYTQAVQLFSIANALRTRQSAPLSAADAQVMEQVSRQAHSALGEERFTTAWRRGERLAQERTNFAALFEIITNATTVDKVTINQ